MKNLNKKGQTGGLVTNLIMGVAALVIVVIIAFIIVSTLDNANLLTGGRTTSTVVNESAIINYSAGTDTLDVATTNIASYTITEMWGNDTTDYRTIPLANVSVDTAGVITSIDGTFFTDGKISYTYVTKTNEEISVGALSGNLSSGVNNVSSKIPTVLLIAAIVLILGVLAVLVGVWSKMRMGGGSI